jgi:ABC-2 type transport system permease protein
MLPGIWGQIVDLLPLKYLAYFPSAVFLEKVTGAELARGLAVQLGWVLFFMVACRTAYERGLRRYSAFGG